MDPYYLTAKTEATGYHPEIILAGRRINDSMSGFIAQKCVKLLIARHVAPHRARVGILGLTFKEDVPDLRNSQIPKLHRELLEFGIDALVHDPHASPLEARTEYGLNLAPLASMAKLDALIIAVPHSAFREIPTSSLLTMVSDNGVIIDVKSILDPSSLPHTIGYWSL